MHDTPRINQGLSYVADGFQIDYLCQAYWVKYPSLAIHRNSNMTTNDDTWRHLFGNAFSHKTLAIMK
jgi:hypothetical protein